jgi:hypothetical protein
MSSPGLLSRYRYCFLVQEGEITWLSDREPFPYQPFEDNRRHVVRQGDTLWGLAARYFRLPGIIDRPSDLWSLIADFQPEPVFDPTVRLEVGRVVHIPSFRTVFERIFAESRRAAHQ